MKVLDPGHSYELKNLDVPEGGSPASYLVFVKREGFKYPGNVGSYSGTTLQEVLRACIDRLRYVNQQEYSLQTDEAIDCCMDAIYLLEYRAAKRHGRPAPLVEDAVFGETCPKCLHVGCKGECH